MLRYYKTLARHGQVGSWPSEMSNVEKKSMNSGGRSFFEGMLKSPRTTSGVPSSGEQLRRASISSKRSQRKPGGRYITTMLNLKGSVTETAWNSKADVGRWSRGRTWWDHMGEMRRLDPPPRPVFLGEREKE